MGNNSKDNNAMVKLAVEFLKNAHKNLEGTMADVTEKQLHSLPPGKAHPLGATYAHLIFSEDYALNGILMHNEPLAHTSWKGKTGASELMPAYGPEWGKYDDWTKNVKINLEQMRKYAQAVYENTENYLMSLSDEDISKELDLTSMGMGKVKFSYILWNFLLEHTANVTGEISVLKGIQGAKGYPY